MLKEAVIPVPPDQVKDRYYSTYFIVPKKDGGLRPILNLKIFNNCINKTKFSMETLKSIISVMSPGLWLASVDFKDAYFHVPIHWNHRKLLSFSWKGQDYQFQALTFGLSTAPRVFTKVLSPVIAHLHLGRV